MATLGFRTINEMVGQADSLKVKEDIAHWKYKQLDLSAVLHKEPVDDPKLRYKNEEQDHGLAGALDWKLLEAAKPALERKEKVKATFEIKNTDRTAGTILSNEISRKYLSAGLPDDTIHFKFRGSAGQSFAAFNTKGVTMELEGEANDYFGKGLSGARLVLYPDHKATFRAEDNIIVGNVAFYGATSGEAYIRGRAGERFCVRNSGAQAVVEGVGDHGCEYMTGGKVVILGKTGRNFAAGMSGGVAYIYDLEDDFKLHCNTEMVDLDPLDEEDARTLQTLINRHQMFTQSAVADFLLKDWDNQLKHFVKVFPKEFKRVLQAQLQEEISGVK
jgi:glutamate synthase (NADPH/NADH) large chain